MATAAGRTRDLQKIDGVEISLADLHSHALAGAPHLFHCSFNREAIQVGHLDLGDLFYLFLSYLADLVLVWLCRTLCNIDGALDQNSYRGSLGDECERSVGVDRDHNGDDQAFLILRGGFRIKRLAKLHNIDTL